MTVSTTINKVTYQGDNSSTTFSFSFPGVAIGDIEVFFTDAAGNVSLLSPSFYTVALNAPISPNPTGIGGVVTYPLTGSPIALGTQLTIERTLSEVQALSLSNQGPVPTDIEQALDYATMLIQQLQNLLNQSIQVQPSDPIPAALPSVAQRAGLIMGFDSHGNPIATTGGGASVNISSAMTPLVQASSVAVAQSILGISSLPAGVEVPWAGIFNPPNGWYLEYGQAISRTADAALFNVVCPELTGVTITSGSATVTGISTTANLAIGHLVESPALPGGTAAIQSIASGTSVVLDATASSNGTQMRVFVHGRGDGSTTFNIPDSRCRAMIGVDNPLNNGANNIISVAGGNFDASKLSYEGVQSIALAVSEIPSHSHPGTTTSITDPEHTHTTTIANLDGLVAGGGGSAFTTGTATVEPVLLSPSATGITASTAVAAQGGGQGHANVQPVLMQMFIIYRGINPTLL